MKKLMNAAGLCLAFLIFWSCAEQELGVPEVPAGSENPFALKSLPSAHVAMQNESLSADTTIKQQMLNKSWSMSTISYADPNEQYQLVGLSFLEDGTMYWADIDGTFRGNYTITDNIVSFNLKRFGQDVFLKYIVEWQPDETLYFALLWDESTFPFDEVTEPYSGNYNNYEIKGTQWKVTGAYPEYPGYDQETYTIDLTGKVMVIRNGHLLASGRYVQDSFVPLFGRIILDNGVRMIISKDSDWPNEGDLSIDASEFFTDGSVGGKVMIPL